MERRDDTEHIGLSLFTESNTIQVENEQTEEEAEAQEDQRRRQHELQNLIANAFDDICYDDNSTINSSCAGSVNGSTNRSLRNKHDSDASISESQLAEPLGMTSDEIYRNTSLNSTEQLQVLYKARVKENKYLSEQLLHTQEESKRETDLLKKKIILLKAENDGYVMSIKQSQDLLKERVHEVYENRKEIDFLKNFLEKLQESKDKMEDELDNWKATTDELRQKLSLMDKGLHTPVSERQIKMRYESEISDLQIALENAHIKLERVERNNVMLQNEIQEQTHVKEVVLREKNEAFNALSKTLEDSQAQCRTLMTKMASIDAERQNIHHEMSQAAIDNVTTLQAENAQQNEVINTLQDELKRSHEKQTEKENTITLLETEISKQKALENVLLLSIEDKTTKFEIEQDMLLRNMEEKLQRKNTEARAEHLLLQKINIDLKEKNKKLKIYIQKLKFETDNSESREDKKLISQYERDIDKLKRDIVFLKEQLNLSENWKEQYHRSEDQCTQQLETIAQLTEEIQNKAAILNEYIELRSNPVCSTIDRSMCTEEVSEFHSGINQLKEEFATTKKTMEVTISEIFKIKISELDELVAAKQMHINALIDENKCLKEKIIFDRNALSELFNVWNTETNRLQICVEELNELKETHKKEIELHKKKEVHIVGICNELNDELDKAKNTIKHVKTNCKQKEDHLKSEYDRIQQKFITCLEVIQKRVSQHVKDTDAKYYREQKEIEIKYNMLMKKYQNPQI